MIDKEMLEAIGQMMDSKLEKALTPINERLDGIDKRLDRLESGQKITNKRLAKIEAVQEYLIGQTDLLDEVKMDKDPMRKRA